MVLSLRDILKSVFLLKSTQTLLGYVVLCAQMCVICHCWQEAGGWMVWGCPLGPANSPMKRESCAMSSAPSVDAQCEMMGLTNSMLVFSALVLPHSTCCCDGLTGGH